MRRRARRSGRRADLLRPPTSSSVEVPGTSRQAFPAPSPRRPGSPKPSSRLGKQNTTAPAYRAARSSRGTHPSRLDPCLHSVRKRSEAGLEVLVPAARTDEDEVDVEGRRRRRRAAASAGSSGARRCPSTGRSRVADRTVRGLSYHRLGDRRDLDAEGDVPQARVVEARLPTAGERGERRAQHERRLCERQLERAPEEPEPRAREHLAGSRGMRDHAP